ncbi:MAG: flavodoxin [Ruminiclostridium sp.]|nr:flavodoxin [Ruminiclostridium sp.]
MGKSLIVYYSFEGNTEFAARTLAKHIGAYVERIIPLKQPPKKGFGKFFWGGKSVVMKERPVLEPLQREITEFDNIIIGFPIWAGSYPPAIYSFTKDYPFSGKNCYIIACSSSGNAKKAIAKITERLSGNKIIDTLSLIDPAKNKEKNEKLVIAFADKNFDKAEAAYKEPEPEPEPEYDNEESAEDDDTIEFSETEEITDN